MSKIMISTLAKKWMKDPAFRREYEALEEEFALASADDRCTRPRAALRQAQVAQAVKHDADRRRAAGKRAFQALDQNS